MYFCLTRDFSGWKCKMHKRILQALAVLLLMGVMLTFISVDTAMKQEAIRIEEEKAAQEQLARERAALAWESLTVDFPEIHIGCLSTISDLIEMGSQVEFPTINEVIENEPIIQIIGTVYEAGDPPLVGIDPGHLGYTVEKYKNTGAVSVHSGMVEHEWSLKVARVLKEMLLERGYDVYMVRDTDDWKEFPYNNGDRTLAANAVECDILVAIHWDSFDQAEVDGYHTIYKGSTKTPNYRLAKAVSDAYGKAIDGAISKYANPVGRDDLWQLNVATMPAVIVECGFSSNPSDAAWLENEDNYAIMAEGIADGIDNYFDGERKR